MAMLHKAMQNRWMRLGVGILGTFINAFGVNYFIVLMGLIPFVLGMASWLVTKHYPITDEVRQQMQEKLSK